MRSLSSPPHGREFRTGQAIALGVLHGPAELLPVSSSGHVGVIPWFVGWNYQELDEELRKSFEVAVHAGTAAGLLIALRSEVAEAARRPIARRLGLLAMSSAPPAAVGYGLERMIEHRLGTPAMIAAGLIAGSVAMALADRAPRTRRQKDWGALDALSLGAAQAFALVPGVSRNGATLAAARARGFAREDANRLSRHVALPVIAGATLLRGVRLSRKGIAPGTALPLAAGAAAAFVSTLGSTWVIGQIERDRSLLPYAGYRAALALGVVVKLRRQTRPVRRGAIPPTRRIAFPSTRARHT